MRARLAAAPAGFWPVFQGVLFAGWMAVWSMVSWHTGWLKALISAVVIAPLYALVLWLTTRRHRNAEDAIVGAMTVEQRRDVLLAAKTGTPPDDVALRLAAVAMVRNRFDEHDLYRTFAIPVFIVFMALSALCAITGGLWWLAATALFGWLLILTVRYTGQLTGRLATLEAAARAAPRAHSRLD